MSNAFETFGLECGAGWRSLYKPLAERCRAENIAICQIKEKFGQLRFYTAKDGSEELKEAILAAEAASAGICEVCGRPGKRSNRKGFIMTRCSAHRDMPAAIAGLFP